MKILFTNLLLLMISFSFAQVTKTTSYTDSRGNVHLAGPFDLTRLETDTLYNKWYNENYQEFTPNNTEPAWKTALKDTQVDIYLGTWCGDSKNWVPKFIHLWDELGLDRSQLSFTALYNGTEKYKQGPNGEEKGLNIHRVPTFIFKKDGQEYARMVEYPVNDLETDIAQIALGYPSAPSYRAANYLMQLTDQKSTEEIYGDFREHIYHCYDVVSKMNELNTLGYVFLRAGEVDKALIAFEINTYLFRYDPKVYDSYGEALHEAGKNDIAITQYEKVLEIDPENKNAAEMLKKLKG